MYDVTTVGTNQGLLNRISGQTHTKLLRTQCMQIICRFFFMTLPFFTFDNNLSHEFRFFPYNTYLVFQIGKFLNVHVSNRFTKFYFILWIADSDHSVVKNLRKNHGKEIPLGEKGLPSMKTSLLKGSKGLFWGFWLAYFLLSSEVNMVRFLSFFLRITMSVYDDDFKFDRL